MKDNEENPKPEIYVGQGLTEKSHEECVARGINPNPNPPGEFRDFSQDPEGFMEEFVKADMEDAIAALKDTTYERPTCIPAALGAPYGRAA